MFIKIGDVEPIQAIIISGEDVESELADEMAIVADETIQAVKKEVVQKSAPPDSKDQ